MERFGTLAVREPVLLELPLGRSPPQGGRLELLGTLNLPRTADDGFDERSWLRRQGIHVVIEGSRWRMVGRRGGLVGLADRLHAYVGAHLAPGVEGERRVLVAGVVLGEDEGLEPELKERFRASGLQHLLAVSGQNVAYLAGGVLLLAWLVGAPRLVGEFAVLTAILGYVAAVGWQPSVVRAGVAGCLASLAWLAARPRDRWYFLLLGAAVLLGWNPYSLLEAGFQLSFAAVAAIFVVVPRLEQRLEGYPVPRPLALVLALSVGCGLATAPILWLHFGAFPLFSVLANALAAPVVAPLLALGLGAVALDPILPEAALALAWFNAWLAAYLAACARLVGSLPHAEIASARSAALLVASLTALTLVPRLGARGRRFLAALGLVAVAVAVGLRFTRDVPPAPKGLRLTFLDVGQGDGILLQTAAGAVLVDQGPPEGRVAEQLERLGVRRLALLVLTHPQRDHVGGAAEVLRSLPVDLALDPRLTVRSLDESEALRAAKDRGVPVALARAGRGYRVGALELRVLWPEDRGLPGQDPNENATVLLARYGEVEALLTADAEGAVTTLLRPPRVEILKVAHHGSADPQLPALLRLVRPRVAVISVGRSNDYGHPAPSTLGALEEAPSLEVLRTDRDGRVTIETDGRRIEVTTEHDD